MVGLAFESLRERRRRGGGVDIRAGWLARETGSSQREARWRGLVVSSVRPGLVNSVGSRMRLEYAFLIGWCGLPVAEAARGWAAG